MYQITFHNIPNMPHGLVANYVQSWEDAVKAFRALGRNTYGMSYTVVDHKNCVVATGTINPHQV